MVEKETNPNLWRAFWLTAVDGQAAQSKRTTQKERIVKDRVQQLINNAEGIGWGGDSPSEGAFQFQAEPMNVEGQLLPLLPRYAPVPDATSPAAASPTSNRP
jgi:hypothetical protein